MDRCDAGLVGGETLDLKTKITAAWFWGREDLQKGESGLKGHFIVGINT